MSAPLFSICIPNYNYARYLPRTIGSVLTQDGVELEVVVADNASTDGSVKVIEGLGDPRVRVRVNACNVGFAGNLDRAARLATGRYLNLLSSDDLMRPGALATARTIFDAVGERVVVTSRMDLIDPDDVITGSLGPDPSLWRPGDRDAALEVKVGAPVYRVAAGELLGRALAGMRNPFNFAATIYPRGLYEAVEGYGGGRLINPDKWFHWKLLGVADQAIFVDRPGFAYRWHPNNQTAQQAATGALKYLVDEYVSTVELSADKHLLACAGVDRHRVEAAFVEHDIARHGLATLARGDRAKARRILMFGGSVYPQHTSRNWKVWGLGALLALGGVGERVARAAYARVAPERGEEAR